MREVFYKRRATFLQRCGRYLSYVLNDHFVLVLLVLFGFLALQYRKLLEELPQGKEVAYLILGLVSLLLLFSGRVATYLEEADQVFLLPKEKEVQAWIGRSFWTSFLGWASLQGLGQVLLLPLYLKLGLNSYLFAGYLSLLTLLKYVWFRKQTASWSRSDRLNWEQVILDEQRRQRSILQFFSLFTQVKGISGRVQRRPYLDCVLGLMKKQPEKTWEYLYARAFLRAGDYFWLTVRLTGLGFASLFLVEEPWLAVGLVILFDYLLLFQLLGLHGHYDYQYVTKLYPVGREMQLKNFQVFLRQLMLGLLFFQVLVAGIWLRDLLAVAGLLGAGLLLLGPYVKWKSEKLID